MNDQLREISLDTLRLENFKGMIFTLESHGDDTDVSGRNATGKTTLADAFMWVLFGKDSAGRSQFEIKNLDSQGEAEHGVEHSVEVVLRYNGQPVTFKKTLHEVWTKKRGSAQATLTGNTTDYFIDGVPAKENEYKARIAELFKDEETVRLLTSPTAFPVLPWQKQRSLLLTVCGGYTDAQVIETDESLAPLTDLLQRFTVSKTPMDDLKKVVMSGRTEINKQLDALPIRIDEVRRGLPDVKDLDLEGLKADVAYQEGKINELKLRLQGVDTGGRIADISKQLAGVEADLTRLQNGHYAVNIDKVNKLNAKIKEITDAKGAEERTVQGLKNELATKQERMAFIARKLDELRAQWFEIDGQHWEGRGEIKDKCPACGQALPEDQIQAAIDKALAAFNRQKARDLEDIDTNGKGYMNERNRLTGEIKKIEETLASRPDISTEGLDALVSERDSVKTIAEDYSLIPGREDLLTKKTFLEIELRRAREGVASDREPIQKEITDREVALRETKEKLGRFGLREAGEKRIEELKAEEKRLTKEYEGLEKQLFLIESFIKRKVSLLTDRINSKFELARFKLFNTLINGGLEECCEITVNGVGYNSNLNNAARINAGLDVCRTLARHYGILLPIFIDNAESVCELLPMEAQVIRLVVSEKDKVLRVERAAGGKKMAA